MVRPIVKAYLWLAALWSLGSWAHAFAPWIPVAAGVIAGLAVAAWYLGEAWRALIARRAPAPMGTASEPRRTKATEPAR